MSFITLISDYGYNSPYTASLKGVIYTSLPGAIITDISHGVRTHDILQAAYILKNAVKHFPQGTVHLVAVDTSFALHQQFLIIEHNDQFYIGADNGIFSLLFDKPPGKIVAIKPELIDPDDLFPEKNVFVRFASMLAQKIAIDAFTVPAQINNIKQHIAPVIEEDLLRGSVVFIDGYGNAITNISKELFNRKTEARSKFAIFYRRREKLTYISRNYSDVKNGYELALFNEAGFLEIAMNTGKAGQLLGLHEGSQVIIEFYD